MRKLREAADVIKSISAPRYFEIRKRNRSDCRRIEKLPNILRQQNRHHRPSSSLNLAGRWTRGPLDSAAGRAAYRTASVSSVSGEFDDVVVCGPDNVQTIICRPTLRTHASACRLPIARPTHVIVFRLPDVVHTSATAACVRAPKVRFPSAVDRMLQARKGFPGLLEVHCALPSDEMRTLSA